MTVIKAITPLFDILWGALILREQVKSTHAGGPPPYPGKLRTGLPLGTLLATGFIGGEQNATR